MITQNKCHFAVLVIAITLVLMTAFQMRQISTERTNIDAAFAQQDQALQQTQKVGAQFESLAVGTAKLAGEGNATAREIIAQLNKIGVNVNPNATAGQKSLEFRQPPRPEGAGATTPQAPATPEAPAAVGQ